MRTGPARRLLVVDTDLVPGGVATVQEHLSRAWAVSGRLAGWVLPAHRHSSVRPWVGPEVPLYATGALGRRGVLGGLLTALARRGGPPALGRLERWRLRRWVRRLGRAEPEPWLWTHFIYHEPPPGRACAGWIFDLSVPEPRARYLAGYGQWLREARRVFVPSRETARQLQEQVHPVGGRAEVVPIPPAPPGPVQPVPADLAHRRWVVQIGSLRGHKGHATVLRACHRLRDQGLDVAYAALGPGTEALAADAPPAEAACAPAQTAYRALVAAHPGAALALGAVAPEVREGWYEAAWRVVVASRSEGFGLPLAEALVRGVRAVASDLPPLREQVEFYRADDDVHWCPPGDEPAWTAALAAATEDRRPRRDPATAHQRLRQWTWPDLGARLVAALEATDPAPARP